VTTSLGRALVQARGQRHGKWTLYLHWPAWASHAAEQFDPPLLDPPRERGNS
jgi:hypothetical protein